MGISALGGSDGVATAAHPLTEGKVEGTTTLVL